MPLLSQNNNGDGSVPLHDSRGTVLCRSVNCTALLKNKNASLSEYRFTLPRCLNVLHYFLCDSSLLHRGAVCLAIR